MLFRSLFAIATGVLASAAPGPVVVPAGTVRAVITVEAPPQGVYACPDHPNEIQAAAGRCPRCGATLEHEPQVVRVALESMSLLRVPPAARWPADANLVGLLVGPEHMRRFLPLDAHEAVRVACHLAPGPTPVAALIHMQGRPKDLRIETTVDVPSPADPERP